MFNKRDLLKNIIKQDEKIMTAKVLDQASLCLKNFETVFTEFYDPYKISQFLNFVKNENDLNIKTFGGYEESERLMLAFSPNYIEVNENEFPIAVLEICFNEKFSRKLTHRDFLGSILGLGIVRGKIGDIIIQNEKAVVFVNKDISEYICINLERVSNTKVTINNFDIKQFVNSINSTDEQKEYKITVASLRIDAMLSAAFNLSRSKASALILSEKVFVNWSVTCNTSKQVLSGDIITLRGIGRIKIIEVLGKTKKDRFLVNLCKYN